VVKAVRWFSGLEHPFYSALHVIEALLSCQNPARHGHNHEDREHLIKCNSLYDPITKHYRRLEAASSVARYLKKYPGFADYMTPREVCQELIQHRLLVIMRFAVECGKLPDAQQRLLRGSIKEIEQLRPSLPA